MCAVLTASYLLVEADTVLGVWLVPALSSASECAVSPPRAVRSAAVSAYSALCVLFVWGHLALFFPPAADSSPSSSDPSYRGASPDPSEGSSTSSIAVSVSAALIAATCCAACWLTLHIAHIAAGQATQFDSERGLVERLAAAAGQSRADGSVGRPLAAAIAWQATDAVVETVDNDGCAVSDGDNAELLARDLLVAAKARARRSIPKVESFSSAPLSRVDEHTRQSADQRPSHTAAPVRAAWKPPQVASFNKVRPAAEPTSAAAAVATGAGDSTAAADELLSFVQSFQSLIQSPAPLALCSRAEHNAAVTLHDRYIAWMCERRLFEGCRSVQLHHMLTLALHDDIDDTTAMCKHFETLQDQQDDELGKQRRRDRLTARHLALLSIHHRAVHQLSSSSSAASSAPSTQWSQYGLWLTKWRAYRAALSRAARQRRRLWDDAAARRQQAVRAAAERQSVQAREAIAQRRAERRKAMQACQPNNEEGGRQTQQPQLQSRQRRVAASATGALDAVTDKQQAGKRRRNNRTARRRRQHGGPGSQRQPPDESLTDRQSTSQSDEADHSAATTNTHPSQQPQTIQEDDSNRAVGGCRYQHASITVRGAVQPPSNTHKRDKANSGAVQQVSSAHRHTRNHATCTSARRHSAAQHSSQE